MSEKVYRLKEEHPTAKKVRALEALATELGISFSTGVNDQILIQDNDHPSTHFEYRDIEQSYGGFETTTEFPLGFESKVIRVEE